MRRRVTALFGCCWTLILYLNSPAYSAMFAIAAPTFSGFARCSDPIYVVQDPAVAGRISKAKLQNGRLYFSFRVIGQDDAIKHLKQYGTLDVTAVIWTGGEKAGEQSIGITQDNWERNGAKLVDEYERTGIFNWRTCFFTQQPNASSVQIQIRDANMDFASPIDVGGSYEASVTINP